MRLLLLVLLTFVLSACDDGGNADKADSMRVMEAKRAAVSMGGGMATTEAMVAPAMAPMSMSSAQDAAVGMSAPPSSMVLDRGAFNGRRIAETHSMQIETPYDQLQTRFQRDYAKCVALGCEVQNSSVQLEQGGNITARIAPAKLGELLDFLAAGPGKILNHSVSADDQTMEYADTKAQMDNLLASRERLRNLMNSDLAKDVDGVLRIEQELNRIQTEIDQHNSRLQFLLKQTEMATVNLSYQVEYRPVEAQPYTLKNTLKNALQRFYYALDRVIQFIGGVLPWLPIVFLGVWLGVRMVRFAFARVSLRWPWKKG